MAHMLKMNISNTLFLALCIVVILYKRHMIKVTAGRKFKPADFHNSCVSFSSCRSFK